MTELATLSGDTAVTSTLTIAENTHNEHASVIALVRKYQADLQDFGEVDLRSTRPERGGHLPTSGPQRLAGLSGEDPAGCHVSQGHDCPARGWNRQGR